MQNNSFLYAFKTAGLERKVAAAVIGEVLGAQVKYSGPPTFSYEADGWRIDRNGMITTPQTETGEIESLRPVLEALMAAGAVAEGDGEVTVGLTGHTGVTLRNLVNLISSKDKLLQQALGREQEVIPAGFVNDLNEVCLEGIPDFAEVTVAQGNTGGLNFDFDKETIGFRFFNASLNADEVIAHIILSWRINGQAKVQKFSSFKQKETDNAKFTMRCWLIRLGFVGDGFKTERKILLERLPGNAAFKTEAARQKAEEKRRAVNGESR